jgi:hypothetical protein
MINSCRHSRSGSMSEEEKKKAPHRVSISDLQVHSLTWSPLHYAKQLSFLLG